MEDEISLRPFAVRAKLGAVVSPFSAFAKGAGVDLKAKNRAELWEEGPRKKPEERIRYTKEFLEKFKQRYQELPLRVEIDIGCFGTGEDLSKTWTKSQQDIEYSTASQGVQNTGGTNGLDDRDWHVRQHQTAQARQAASTSTPIPAPLPPEGTDLNKMHTASEKGKEAYKPGSIFKINDNEKAVRSINGILNKITPDNFEKLVKQVTDLVTSPEVLQKTISLVFEKAVAEPTFCALYAELCEYVNNKLPDFPGDKSSKPITFKRVLLNTCQDEFEGVERAREGLKNIEDEREKQILEKQVKNRTLGNVRLIAELFKKGLVLEKIMHSCMQELLKTDKEETVLPHEDNIEAACEMLTLAGKKLSETEKFKKFLTIYLLRLQRFQKHKNISSRISFIIKDIFDMQKNKWVPRREKFTAKKIDKIWEEAETEMGHQVRMPQQGPKSQKPAVDLAVNEAELFPTPQRFTSEGEWKAVAEKLHKEQQPAFKATPPMATTTKIKKSPGEYKKSLESMFREFLSSRDFSEAALCVTEGNDTSLLPMVADIGLQIIFDCAIEKEREVLIELLIKFLDDSVYSADEMLGGVRAMTDQMDDLVLDVPKAPEICGSVLGKAIAKGYCDIESLPLLCKGIGGAEARRPFAASVFSTIVALRSAAELEQMCKASNIHALNFLEPKESWDPPDMLQTSVFLHKLGYSFIPL